MARLETTKARLFPRGYTCLELTPNMPEPRDLVDTYMTRLWIHDRLIYDRVHSVRDWQLRHYWVLRIAYAFCNAPSFVDRQIEYLPEPNLESRAWYVASSEASAHFDAEWMQVDISAALSKGHGELVQVNLFLQNTRTRVGDFQARSEGRWGESADFTWAMILCRPDDAVAWGRKLLAEIDAAEVQRIERGIPKYDDPSYSE